MRDTYRDLAVGPFAVRDRKFFVRLILCDHAVAVARDEHPDVAAYRCDACVLRTHLALAIVAKELRRRRVWRRNRALHILAESPNLVAAALGATNGGEVPIRVDADDGNRLVPDHVVADECRTADIVHRLEQAVRMRLLNGLMSSTPPVVDEPDVREMMLRRVPQGLEVDTAVMTALSAAARRIVADLTDLLRRNP